MEIAKATLAKPIHIQAMNIVQAVVLRLVVSSTTPDEIIVTRLRARRTDGILYFFMVYCVKSVPIHAWLLRLGV